MPKPRNTAQLMHEEEAMRVRSHVIEALTASVSERSAGSSAGLQSCKTIAERGVRLQPDRKIRLKADPTNAVRGEA
jgi:hypothetical protein